MIQVIESVVVVVEFVVCHPDILIGPVIEWERCVKLHTDEKLKDRFRRKHSRQHRRHQIHKGHVWPSGSVILRWHKTGGGLDENVIQELIDHGYNIRRNGVSNYTLHSPL